MLIEVEKYYISDVYDFVKKFNLQDLYQKLFNQSIENWIENKNYSDNEIIAELLENLEKKYFFEFIDDNNFGYFNIYELKEN